MTKKDIIRMARQAGIDSVEQYDSDTSPIVLLERFATLVASSAQAKEREACLKFCDEVAEYFPSSGFVGSFIGSKIRARGQV